MDRFVAQAEFVPRELLTAVKTTVIGVGAIGRQVALQLAAIGARHIRVIDPDVVDNTNVTTQGYKEVDIGREKVAAVAASIAEIDRAIVVETIADRYRPIMTTSGGAVFCCVDNIDSRQAIWRSAGKMCDFWADGRMLGEVMRVIAGPQELMREYYPMTLFAREEAQVGRCTARSTIYTAAIAAGLMIHQFTKWLRGVPAPLDIILNLLATELNIVKDSS